MSWIRGAKNGLNIHYNFAVFGLRPRFTQRIDNVGRLCGMSRSTVDFFLL